MSIFRTKRFFQFFGLCISLLAVALPIALAKDPNQPPSSIDGFFITAGALGVLAFVFWLAYDYDKIARLFARKSGGRFSRTLKIVANNDEKIFSWAKKFGYVVKSEANANPIIFAKKSYPIYPIFVSVERLPGDLQTIEGWVSSHSRDYPLKSGFQILGAIRVGAKDLNALLDECNVPVDFSPRD